MNSPLNKLKNKHFKLKKMEIIYTRCNLNMKKIQSFPRADTTTNIQTVLGRILIKQKSEIFV